MVSFSSTPIVDQSNKMAKSVKPTFLSSKLGNKKTPSSPNQTIPCCGKSPSAFIDVLFLIAVLIALGFLFLSFSKIFIVNSIEIMLPIIDIIKEDISEAPIIYGFLGLGIICTIIATVAIIVCTNKLCGKIGCKGLHKAAEFDIQLETEDSINNSDNLAKNEVKKGLFQLPRDRLKELETQLKKMAPVNGKAVLIYRARCGCAVGRMEVPGPKKTKKVKK